MVDHLLYVDVLRLSGHQSNLQGNGVSARPTVDLLPELHEPVQDGLNELIGRDLARRMVPSELRHVRRPAVREPFAQTLHAEVDAQHEPTEAERRTVDLDERSTVASLRLVFLSPLPDRQSRELFDALKELEQLAAGEDAAPPTSSTSGLSIREVQTAESCMFSFRYVSAAPYRWWRPIF